MPREVGNEEAVAARRILIVHARVGEVDQRPDLASTDVPPIGQHELAIEVRVTRLVWIIAPHGSVHFEPAEVERTTRPHVDQTGDTGLDQVRGGCLESFDRLDSAGWEILQRN